MQSDPDCGALLTRSAFPSASRVICSICHGRVTPHKLSQCVRCGIRTRLPPHIPHCWMRPGFLFLKSDAPRVRELGCLGGNRHKESNLGGISSFSEITLENCCYLAARICMARKNKSARAQWVQQWLNSPTQTAGVCTV